MKPLKIFLFLSLLALAACKKDSNIATAVKNITGTWVARSTINTSQQITIQLNADSTFKSSTTFVDATGAVIGYVAIVTGKYHFSGMVTSSSSPVLLTEYGLTTLNEPTAGVAVSDASKLVVNTNAPPTLNYAIFWNADNSFALTGAACAINNPGNIDCGTPYQFMKQ